MSAGLTCLAKGCFFPGVTIIVFHWIAKMPGCGLSVAYKPRGAKFGDLEVFKFLPEKFSIHLGAFEVCRAGAAFPDEGKENSAVGYVLSSGATVGQTSAWVSCPFLRTNPQRYLRRGSGAPCGCHTKERSLN